MIASFVLELETYCVNGFATTPPPTTTTPPPTTTTPPPTTTTTTTTTTTVPRGEEGCTPGFWKNHPEGYTSDMLVGDVFADAPGELAGLALQEGLELGGGQENALLRHAIAAVLNAASGGVDFALTVEEVVEMVNAAFRGEEDVEATKDILEGFNEAGCPL